MIQELQSLLIETLQGLGISDVVAQVSSTQDPLHGDYATNVAFVVAKKLGLSPMDAASKIADELAKDMPPSLEKVEVAKPGFINLTVSKDFLLESLNSRVMKTELPMKSAQFGDRKIMVEFTDPNPFKEFHIGHLYSNIVGESISRLMEAVGAEVKRVCYQGDVGLHVAKSVWGMRELSSKIPADDAPLSERANFLGRAYALGATKFEEDESVKQEIIEINKKVYANDAEIMPLYEKGRAWSLAYFDSIYTRLGTKFWKFYFESAAGPIGLELVKEYQAKGIFEESQGAVIFAGEKYGLHSRVFINSLGLPTYEAKELGLALTKFADYPFDHSIMITGNEIDEYFKVLLKAISLIRPDIAEKMKHMSHGMVRLPEGKMSSRTGNVLTGEWLLEEAVRRAGVKIREVKGEGSRVAEDAEEYVTEQVGVGAVKWALLRSGIGKDIEFSFDESVSFEGNSGPYLQYTYVRTRSVLEKAGKTSPTAIKEIEHISSVERQLLVHLNRYQDTVVEAALRYSPTLITTYLFELAQLFNLFYQKHPILKEEGNVKDFRLSLTQGVGETIKNGLAILGISVPERM